MKKVVLLPYLLAVLAYFSWSLGDVSIKLAGADIPPFQVLFFSAVFAFPVILIIAIFSKTNWRTLKINKKKSLSILVVFQLLTSLTSIIAVTRIPLSNFYILFFVSALLIPIFARFILKEKTSSLTLFLIVVGFMGCYIAVDGFEISNNMNFYGLLAGICCAISYAMAEVFVRKGSFSETHISMIFWPALFYLIVCGVYLLITSDYIHINLIPYMAFNGVTWVLGWWFLINALKRTIVGELSSFMFLLLPYGLLFDALIWNELPSLELIIGSFIVVFAISGLMIVRRKNSTSLFS